MHRNTLALAGLLTLGTLTVTAPVQAQVTAVPQAMNFQGRLTKPDGTPVADGIYSIRFSLHDALNGGTEKWNQTINLVTVRNGVFAVLLAGFPAGTFNTNLFLEIKIGSDAPLTPRQPMVSVAYAMKANSVVDSAITGASIANGTITADKLAFSVGGNGWGLTGNAGIDELLSFLGTTDNKPLVLKTNNRRAARYSYGENTSAAQSSNYYRSINMLAGADINEILDGVVGATIAGGGQDFFGATDARNRVLGDFGTIGGGAGNTVSGQYAIIAGGSGNTASSLYATVGGGRNSQADTYATVAGGYANAASGEASAVGGGTGNFAGGLKASIGGGNSNDARGEAATVGGGDSNAAGGLYATVPGGVGNIAQGRATFAAGYNARALHDGAFVWADPSRSLFASTAINQFLIGATNGVGINKNNPQPGALDVNGPVLMTGFRLTTTPAAGRILTSDASGNGTWQPFSIAGISAGGSLTGTYPNPSIANNAVTNAKIADVAWSKVTGAPSAFPPSGTAGGDLTGTYPNPIIANNAVTSAKLTNDAASLSKVSGGMMSSTGYKIGIGTSTPTGTLDVVGQVANGTQTLDQTTPDLAGTNSAMTDIWQSFTPGLSGLLTQVDFRTRGLPTNVTISIYAGEGTSGSLLSTHSVIFAGGGLLRWQSFPLTSPTYVTAGQKYTLRFTAQSGTFMLAWANGDPYAGGYSNYGNGVDLNFRTYVTPAAARSLLTVATNGSVGIQTATPGNYALDVNGSARLSSLTLPAGAGVNKILTSDATGLGAWGGVTNAMIQSVDWSKITNVPVGGGSNWGLSGNAGTTVSHFLGTTDAQPLAFRTNNTEKMRLLANGKLGIGTPTPIGLLDVYGSLPTGPQTLDQHQIVYTNTSQRSEREHWQSFTAGISGRLTVVKLAVMSPSSDAAPGTIFIYEGEGTSGALLATQTITYQRVFNTLQTFSLSNPPLLTAGQKYTIRFNTSVGTISTNWVYYNPSNPYAAGRADTATALDYVFETYVIPIGQGSILAVMDGGNVGVGVSNPSYRLDVQGDINASGSVRASGVVLTSDSRYKQNVTDFDNALDTILALRGVTFDWNREQWKEKRFPDGRQIGFIAQEVEKVLPELVSTDANGYKSVAYANIVPVLVEAVKTLNARSVMQQKQNDSKDAKITALEARLARFEVMIQRMQK